MTTARFIELNLVLGSRHQAAANRQRPAEEDDIYRDTDEPGEGRPEGSEAGPAAATPGERSTPIMVNVNAIRSFYRRQDDRGGTAHTGTRIYFVDGGHIRVTDTIDVVIGLVSGSQTP